MLINNILYTILVVVLSILVFWGSSWLIRKKLKNSQSFVIGLFLGGLLFAGLLFGIGRLYIVDEDKNVETYRAFGTFSVDMVNGSTLTTSCDPDSVMLINNSSHDLILEELVYSRDGGGYGGIYEVEPWSCKSYDLPGNRIYYFFDEEIDESISTRGRKPVERFWLHE